MFPLLITATLTADEHVIRDAGKPNLHVPVRSSLVTCFKCTKK